MLQPRKDRRRAQPASPPRAYHAGPVLTGATSEVMLSQSFWSSSRSFVLLPFFANATNPSLRLTKTLWLLSSVPPAELLVDRRKAIPNFGNWSRK